ncbi:MAG: DUF3110 domain-containing protein [Gomphosphaeria aponina SAG 52.96 = DSM 107014]|uniref:DUF3110 domain-containing protein n=1 Tax=Gomphosphaeria aponina SAG 52.96 = DSM 107014 TaxID=1521640 RepID=A0A941GPY8_9CHRO|nr:DUF3110 domain-containing protein [Gomphosphaeria aponina SAG 52.96 = DSM 107014]
MRVYVLLFNARTENEGIHTIQMGNINKVLMFESEDDAIRYALMLEAQDFSNATVEEFDSREIEEFCETGAYEWIVVKEGMLAVPPETNVEETEWKLEGKEETSDSEMSNGELEAMRRRLEGLL